MTHAPAPSSHPEATHPLGTPHTLSAIERRTMRLLACALVIVIVAIPILALVTLSPIENVALGLAPLVALIVLDIVVVRAHYKRVVLWLLLLLMIFVGIGLLWLINLVLATPLSVPEAATLNGLLSAIVTLLAFLSEGGGSHAPAATVVRRPPPVAFSVEALPEFVHSIEDKCKALNFAIGRVYRNSNGGSAKLRERLRVPREWYNEFHAAEEKTKIAVGLLHRIRDRLQLLEKQEREVLTHAELGRLKRLVRNEDGSSTVLQVLVKNDTDPVDGYFRAALETSGQIIEVLESARD